MSKWSDEETNEPLLADHRNYYKVEKWTKDGRVERMLYAGSNLDRVCRRVPALGPAHVDGVAAPLASYYRHARPAESEHFHDQF
jgi:hypothetical protein